MADCNVEGVRAMRAGTLHIIMAERAFLIILRTYRLSIIIGLVGILGMTRSFQSQRSLA